MNDFLKMIFRFIFVRSSMQNNIQTVLNRTAFRASFLFIGAIIIIANIAFYFYEQRGELKAEQSLSKFHIIKLL